MSLTLNVPINSVSFGQVSSAILRHCYKNNLDVNLFPIGNIDLSSQEEDAEFFGYIKGSIEKAATQHNRINPVFKLWHLNGGYESFSEIS